VPTHLTRKHSVEQGCRPATGTVGLNEYLQQYANLVTRGGRSCGKWSLADEPAHLKTCLGYRQRLVPRWATEEARLGLYLRSNNAVQSGLLNWPPNRSKYSLMTPRNPPKPPKDNRERQNLRLDPKIGAAIDASRKRRDGFCGRNTWIEPGKRPSFVRTVFRYANHYTAAK
jgi:hypothetical protein